MLFRSFEIIAGDVEVVFGTVFYYDRGSALLPGMTELGEEVFHLPVRVGTPAYIGGLADVVRSPRYATAVGLLLEGRDQYLRAQLSRARTTGIGGAAERFWQWAKANF